MTGAGDFHFLTAAQHLQHGDLVSLRAKRLAGTPKYKPGYQVHRVLLVILLDQPSPADTKQLPLGPHHQAKLTPAQPLLAGYHGPPAEQRRTLRPISSRAIGAQQP